MKSSAPNPSSLKQVFIPRSIETRTLVHPATVRLEVRERAVEALRARAAEVTDDSLPEQVQKIRERFAPYSVHVSKSIEAEIEHLSTALTKALYDIVGRWFSDTEADFPGRMPLEEHEEDLLRWIASTEGHSSTRSFEDRPGIWRPDFLIEDTTHRVKICEINARFPYNGLYMVNAHAYASEAMGLGQAGFLPAADYEARWQRTLKLFDPTNPLYILKDQWAGFDILYLARFFHKTTGQSVTFIKPSKLLLLTDASSPTGQALYCTPKQRSDGVEAACEPVDQSTRMPEKIEQISIELYQSELASLASNPELLRTLSLYCTNDFRSILLVHDKRILSIILSELPTMVARGVLTPTDAEALRSGIIPSFLSGSKELRDLLETSKHDVSLKDTHLLKSIRAGVMAGHVKGADLTQAEWLQKLEGSQKPLRPNEEPYVVQTYLKQAWFDIVRPGIETEEKFHLVGMWYVINGEYEGTGIWRLGDDEMLVTLERRGGILMSGVRYGRGENGATTIEHVE